MKNNRLILALAIFTFALINTAHTKSEHEFKKTRWKRHPTPSAAGVVKVTPLGSHEGEFCRNDRALLFEDPTGVRILWDPARTTSEADFRLGDVHVLVLSSVHADHIGDAKPNPSGAGTCAAPSTVSAAPNSNAAAIAAGEMADFLGRKVQNIRGVTTPTCSVTGPNNETTVPVTTPCVGPLRPGGSRMVRLAGATSGVTIATVQAFHSNGIPAALLDSPGVAPGATGYGGNDGGAIINFTNGLCVYLTGDTGLTGDMKTIIKDYYQANLVVVNIGDIVSLGPQEAAYAVNELMKPTSVIPEHINEEATSDGRPVGGRLIRFQQEVDQPIKIVVPLSGVTREFDGNGRCVNCSVEKGR
jgi:L-ascorbate metabolism protein UlaG (beta-lactamase superfamily)